ncbi:MAG: hypothetical protein ABSB00_01215 [Minisyncoccia bacterium]
MYPDGAVYNNYLFKHMDKSNGELKKLLKKWDRKPLFGKILSCLNIFHNHEAENRAIRDLIAVKRKPNGEVAMKVNPKIASWRAERRFSKK